MKLVWPAAEYLDGYIHALEQGWSPDNLRPQVAQEELARIAENPISFLDAQIDREAKGPRVILPDGRTVPRLPGYTQWMWDGTFCGSINFRWQPGTAELPAHCLGHIGYAVVPWKRGRGYATQALKLFLVQVAQEGLPYVEIVSETSNLASRKVIEANGGALVERFRKAEYGNAERLCYRIKLSQAG